MRLCDSSIVRWRIIFFTLLAMTAGRSASAVGWQDVAEGFRYNKITVKAAAEQIHGQVHIFEFDPLKFRLDVITARQFGLISMDAKTMSAKMGAVLAVNGGFFTPEYDSLGLLVQQGKTINKLKWTNWWHVFQMKALKPGVVTKQEFALSPDVEIAIEAGPRLVIDGNVTALLKPGDAERTAIGTTAEGKVVIAVTEDHPVSLLKFAEFLRDAGCVDALNLDGGSSTQAYARSKGFELSRPGLNTVANGIVVIPR